MCHRVHESPDLHQVCIPEPESEWSLLGGHPANQDNTGMREWLPQKGECREASMSRHALMSPLPISSSYEVPPGGVLQQCLLCRYCVKLATFSSFNPAAAGATPAVSSDF